MVILNFEIKSNFNLDIFYDSASHSKPINLP